MHLEKNIKIDAVITWVDGSDIYWQKKINNYSPTKINFSKKKNLKRYNSIGEIDIALKSIIKFADFVENIYLVTDNQIPEKFENLKTLAKQKNINLEIIDHTVIFRDYPEHLPTFNSRSIETVIHNIPNLSENFIIFNDDTFLMRKTNPSDFFIGHKPIIRGKKEKFREDRTLRNIYHRLSKKQSEIERNNHSSFKNCQENSAKLAFGKKSKYYIRRSHTPMPIKKSTLIDFFKSNNVLETNISHKFRHKEQFIISSLSEHLEYKKSKENHTSNTKLTYFRSYKIPLLVKLKLYWFNLNKNKIFMTLQSLEMADKNTLKYITNWIDKKLT